jgi:hypothetical protein
MENTVKSARRKASKRSARATNGKFMTKKEKMERFFRLIRKVSFDEEAVRHLREISS